jgi:hypothetical protein
MPSGRSSTRACSRASKAAGTFLRSNRSENWVGRLMGFSETIKDAGYEPGARVLHQGMTNKHDAGVRARMQERAVWELRRLRLADHTPIAIEHAFYPPDIGLELEKRDLTAILMYRVFESELGLQIKEASQTISATLADDDEARLLGATGRRSAACHRAPHDVLGRSSAGAAPGGVLARLLQPVHQPDPPRALRRTDAKQPIHKGSKP